MAAWDFVKKLSDADKFELSVINPGLITGPHIVKATFPTADITKAVMTGGMPMIQHSVPIINVEDCALAHLRAMTSPEAAGKRFILAERVIWFKDLCDWHHNKFGADGFNKIPRKPMQLGCFIKMLACCVHDIKILCQEWDKHYSVDTSNTMSILGFEKDGGLKNCEEETLKMTELLVKEGYIVRDADAKK